MLLNIIWTWHQMTFLHLIIVGNFYFRNTVIVLIFWSNSHGFPSFRNGVVCGTSILFLMTIKKNILQIYLSCEIFFFTFYCLIHGNKQTKISSLSLRGKHLQFSIESCWPKLFIYFPYWSVRGLWTKFPDPAPALKILFEFFFILATEQTLAGLWLWETTSVTFHYSLFCLYSNFRKTTKLKL